MRRDPPHTHPRTLTPGRADWPGSPTLARLPNVLPLPGMAMRDVRFWRGSAALAASNLRALAAGEPLQHIVRNATHKRNGGGGDDGGDGGGDGVNTN